MLRFVLIFTCISILFVLVYLVLVVFSRNVFVPKYHNKLRLRTKLLPDNIVSTGRKAIFYGMVRDGVPGILSNKKQLISLARFFEEVVFVILENGSVDSTRQFLDAWASSDNRVHIVNGDGELAQRSVNTYSSSVPNSHLDRGPKRIARYVCLRNQLHTSVKDIILSGKFVPTYCIATDLDQERTIDEHGFYSSLQLMDDDQDVVTCSAYGRTMSLWKIPMSTYLYDSYAYHDQWLEDNVTDRSCHNKGLYVWNRKIDVTNQYCKVLSNFGGMCIYRPSEQFLNNYYAVENIDHKRGLCDCEHVGFHKRLTKNSSSRFLITFDSFFLD
jgi:hypothetical protein